jgi:hypothetical protein
MWIVGRIHVPMVIPVEIWRVGILCPAVNVRLAFTLCAGAITGDDLAAIGWAFTDLDSGVQKRSQRP